MKAVDLFQVSTASKIPQVPTVTCPQCRIPWNANGFRVQTGRCACGAKLDKGDAK